MVKKLCDTVNSYKRKNNDKEDDQQTGNGLK